MLFYHIGLLFYQLAIYLVSPFNTKAKKLLKGQKESRLFLRQTSPFKSDDQVIWFHVASLGEFEQARPIIELIRKNNPDTKLLLSFFSPSGYEVRKNYDQVDHVTYLPLDSKKNAAAFIQFYEPTLAIFIKYEFWYHYFKTCNDLEIPIFSISTIFRSKQVFFNRKNKYTQVLNFVNHFFVQNQTSLELLEGIGIQSATLSGDTRFDRVIQLRIENHSDINDIKAFCKEKLTLVIGSLWEEDLIILKDFILNNSDINIIIAPHEIGKDNIQSILKTLENKPVLYSKLSDSYSNILVIDCIGKLTSIYSIADIAYVGGAFGKGLHNILEPATYGLPVIFGPKFNKFQEAIDLVNLKGGFSISSEEEAKKLLSALTNNEIQRKEAGQLSFDYVSNKAGATLKVMEYLDQYLVDER